MKNVDDGVIKYDRSNFSLSTTLPTDEYQELEYWRKKLYDLNLIGEYPIDRVGFGNISQKKDYRHFFTGPLPQFLISGTQTGKYPDLTGDHYTRVINFNLEEQKIFANGPLEASSEALTHAAIYLSNPKIEAIMHIHSATMWKKIIDQKKYPMTSSNIPYGTKEMAEAVFQITSTSPCGIFAMAGHTDGIVTYGRNLNEAFLFINELTSFCDL